MLRQNLLEQSENSKGKAPVRLFLLCVSQLGESATISIPISTALVELDPQRLLLRTAVRLPELAWSRLR